VIGVLLHFCIFSPIQLLLWQIKGRGQLLHLCVVDMVSEVCSEVCVYTLSPMQFLL
jgi:hypothetical protein